MGDMADYYQEQDEMRIEETGRNPYRKPDNAHWIYFKGQKYVIDQVTAAIEKVYRF